MVNDCGDTNETIQFQAKKVFEKSYNFLLQQAHKNKRETKHLVCNHMRLRDLLSPFVRPCLQYVRNDHKNTLRVDMGVPVGEEGSKCSQDAPTVLKSLLGFTHPPTPGHGRKDSQGRNL